MAVQRAPALAALYVALLAVAADAARHASDAADELRAAAEEEVLGAGDGGIVAASLAQVPDGGNGVAHRYHCKKIGSGPRCAVYSARLKSGEELALKVLELRSKEDEAQFKKELDFIKKCQGQSVVSYRGSLTGVANDRRHGFIFMEKGDGTLQDMLEHRRTHFHSNGPEETKRWNRCMFSLGADILRGVEGVLDSHCVHRNIAPSNILIFGNWKKGDNCRAKLADFGGADNVDDLAHHHRIEDLHGVADTYSYTAPEVMLGTEMNTEEWLRTDVWSAGVILTEMFSGRLPRGWKGKTTEWGWKRNGIHKNHELLSSHIDSEVEDPAIRRLLHQMTRPEPEERIGIDVALANAHKLARKYEVSLEPFLFSKIPWGYWNTPPTEELRNMVQSALPWHWSQLN